MVMTSSLLPGCQNKIDSCIYLSPLILKPIITSHHLAQILQHMLMFIIKCQNRRKPIRKPKVILFQLSLLLVNIQFVCMNNLQLSILPTMLQSDLQLSILSTMLQSDLQLSILTTMLYSLTFSCPFSLPCYSLTFSCPFSLPCYSLTYSCPFSLPCYIV